MTLRACSIALLAVLVAAGPALAPAPVIAQGKDVFIPLLVYRTGPFAPMASSTTSRCSTSAMAASTA